MKTTGKEARFLDAASNDHVREVEMFLGQGVNVNVRDSRGTPWNRTALMHAAEKGHLEVVDLLLKAGASVNAKDKGLPIDCPGGNTALILAIRNGHVKVAHHLLGAGASPKTRGGDTSVITAAAYLGNERLFKRLVALGADLNRHDGSRFTAMSSAVLRGHLAIVKALLESGIDPNSVGPGGIPVLVDAASGERSSHKEICKALVEAGADPNRGSENKSTPLMAACRGVSVDIVAYLLKLRVRVNERHARGWTALDLILEKQNMKGLPVRRPDLMRWKRRIAESARTIERLLRQAGARTSEELRKKSKNEHSRPTGQKLNFPRQP